MKYNPNIHKRKSIRLKGYDYSSEGLYFITICCFEKMSLFGRVVDGEMILNEGGQAAKKCWIEIPEHFTNTKLHDFVIMPNHIHGIIEIVGANNHSPDNTNNHSPDNTNNHSPDNTNNHSPDNMNNHSPGNANNHSPGNANNHSSGNTNNHSLNDINKYLFDNNTEKANNDSSLSMRSPSKTIGSMVRGYKIGVTKWFRYNMNDEFPVGKSVWQRNYYEHIIRNENSFRTISDYIKNNPLKWGEDKFYLN